MSADNYYLVRPTTAGKWVAIMGFASDDNEPTQNEHDPVFDTMAEAVSYASDEYSEYGVSVLHYPEGAPPIAGDPCPHCDGTGFVQAPTPGRPTDG